MKNTISSYSAIFIWINLLLLTLLIGCQSPENGGTSSPNGGAGGLNRQFLGGVWTNQAFVEAIQKHDSPYNRFDCMELYFNPTTESDSLWLNRCQSDVAQLGYTHKGKDTLFIAEWQQKGASIMRLGDNALKLVNHNSGEEIVFVRAATNYTEGEKMPPFRYSYRRFMNAQTIAGNYAITDPPSAANREVMFNEDGTLTGLSDFSKYTLWVGGDIGGMCSENLMSFNNMKIDTLYGWHQRGDTLLLCTLKNQSAPDEKPRYDFYKIAIKMVRKQPTAVK